MDGNDFCTLTALATVFIEQTSHTVGRALKEVGLRSPTGKPTPLAYSLKLVQKAEGPQPWIEFWVWHRDKTIPWLEQAGMKRVEVGQKV